MTVFLFDVITKELEDAVERKNCSTRTKFSKTKSKDIEIMKIEEVI